MSQPKVLIAGAGLGGLCLAQGLKKAGVDFHVYERDQASSQRLQGYRIRVHSEGTDALKQCLPAEIYDLFEKTCAEMRTGPGNTADPVTGEIIPQQHAMGRGTPPMFRDPRTVDRRVFRDVLLTRLEEHVTFGKEVDHFTTNGSDSVTLFFKDDSSASGTLLVGADGIHSAVRKQHLPKNQPLDTCGRIIFGKTPLTSELTETFPSELLQRMSMIRDPTAPIPSFTLLEPIVFAPPESRPSHPDLPKDYVYWVMATQKDDLDTIITPEQSRGRITSDVAFATAKKVTAHWHPSLQALFELQDISQTSIMPINTNLPTTLTWETTPTVTLIGDAAHTMPPTAGSGCVTALRDAGVLVDMIEKNGIKDGVAAYEQSMKEYAAETIERSLQAAVKSFGYKPREEWQVAE